MQHCHLRYWGPGQERDLPAACLPCPLNVNTRFLILAVPLSLTISSFWGVFWVDVSSTSSAKNDFLNIAKKLGIHAETIEEARQSLANVKQSSLLVLDNADNPNIDYQCYFPAGLLGVVIMTSRNRECHRYASTPAVELEGLSESEARELLLHATDIPRQQWHRFQDDAHQVATLLQSHPLALIQAGAYISRAHCTIAEYPLVFNRQRKRLLKFRPKQAQSRYGDVYATFEASAGHMQELQADAAQDALHLLSMLGICAASRLPLRHLFKAGWKGAQSIYSINSSDDDDLPCSILWPLTPWHVSHLPPLLEAYADLWDPFRLVEAIGLLKAFSLVSADLQDDWLSVSLHPLTNAWALDRLGTAAQHNAWLATGCLMAVADYGHMLRNMLGKLGRQLQPHLGELVSLDMNTMFGSKPWVKILIIIIKCGWLLDHMRDDAKLTDLMKNLMVYLDLDPLIVNARWLSVYQLSAQNLRNRCEFQTAISLQEQVVQILGRTLRRDHADRLTSEHDLGIAYQDNRQVEKAVLLLEHVVQLREQILAEGYSDRLASQHELERAYQKNGQLRKAIPLLKHVVQIRERTLDKGHPYRLGSQHVLARAYLVDGQVERAVFLLEQVVQIREHTVAQNHPDRLASKHDLAEAYDANGQVEKAVSLLEQVVQIDMKMLAKDYPDLLYLQHNLATCLWHLHRRDAALRMMNHVVEVKRRVLDKRDPERTGFEEWLEFFEDEMIKAKAAESREI
ncbi:MAG: hypothetical protein Q9221_001853 [Calogaya cf. arnoldii]